MTDHRQQGGSKVLVGLSVVILGGLLFAAGVMVGRGTAFSEEGRGKETLGQIDRRDEGSDAAYHEMLSAPRTKPKMAQPVAKNHKNPDSRDAGSVEEHAELGNESTSGRFCLQIASYKEMEQANQLLAKLSGRGYPEVRLLKSDVPGKGVYFRVRLGHFATREQAEKIRKKLAVDQALDAMIVVGD
ncbi:MAG TPA: SPOR domain-containing protein [Myxococcota bacterium]|nr:SPOR domain-containing protein [Myxococcota bacterium]